MGELLEFVELVFADVVEFEELVCFLDYFFCVFAGLVDSADAFCSFFVHGGSFRVGRTAVVGERENPKYGIGG